MRAKVGDVVLIGMLGLAASGCFAQTKQPVRLLVPLPAGGPSDAVARLVAQGLAATASLPVVVDNRPGAAGAIAAQALMTAAPDGNTLLWGIASMATIPLLQSNSPFKELAELTPVALIGRFTYGLTVTQVLPAHSVAELVQYARANPAKLTFATGTLGEFMTTAQFMKATGTSLMRVTYKGGAQALPDLLAGRVQVYFAPVQLTAPQLKDGKLRMLAMVSTRRSALLPDVPTLQEAGVRGVSTPAWQAIFGPPGMARATVAQLHRNIVAVMKDAETRRRLEQQAIQLKEGGPVELAKIVAEDFLQWRGFIKENDIPRE